MLWWKYNIAFCVYCWATCHCQQKKILIVAQKYFCGKYVTRKNKMYLGLHVNCPIFLLFVTKFGVPWQIFLKVSNIKFYRNLSSWNFTDTYWLTDRMADRQGEANGLFCSSADVHKNRCIISLENTLDKIDYFQTLQLLSKECYLHGHLFLYRNIWLNRDAHMWQCRGLFPSASLFISSADSGMWTCAKNNPASLLVC